MLERDDTVYLRHIMDAISRIEGYVAGVTENVFMNHPMIQDAVVRQLEIIGEAIRHVSGSFRSAHPEIRWADPIDMRNRLIHEYFGVDLDVVWSTIREDLPTLRRLVAEALRTG